jgi:hypothetical protein
MRLAFALLIAAAILAWGASALRTIDIVGPSVTMAAPRPPERPVPRPTPEISTLTSTESEPDTNEPPAFAAPPLFRPLTPPENETAAKPGENFVLVGLTRRQDTRLVFLRDQADNRTWTLRAGERVHDWVLEDIADTCVVLRRRADRQSLCL